MTRPGLSVAAAPSVTTLTCALLQFFNYLLAFVLLAECRPRRPLSMQNT
jgi:hypothetical protein